MVKGNWRIAKMKAGYYVIYNEFSNGDDFRRTNDRESAIKIRKMLNDANVGADE